MDQGQDTREQTLAESAKEIMATLPPVARAYLISGQPSSAVKTLTTRYGLSTDQGGVLERELMLLIMGIGSPQEFVLQPKVEADLADETIRGISNDLERDIFNPLYAAMSSDHTPSSAASHVPSSYTAPPIRVQAPNGYVREKRVA